VNSGTLLITGAIDIKKFNVPYTKLIDTDVRLYQYLESIEYAINHYKKITHIVFCENTNYEYDYTALQKKAATLEKVVEILRFLGDYYNNKKNGKGFGEGEIIKYALENSRYLRGNGYFYKLTGRVIVENFDEVIKDRKEFNFFSDDFDISNYSCAIKRCVSTVFFKIGNEDYQKLRNAYFDVDDDSGYFFEHSIYNNLKRNNIKYRNFFVYPKLKGISGSTLGSYKERKEIFILKSMLSRINMLKLYVYLYKIFMLLKPCLDILFRDNVN
jgi:hypothetical protein